MHAETGTMEALPVNTIGECHQLLKSSMHDPDLLTFREAMSGPDRDDFIQAMKK